MIIIILFSNKFSQPGWSILPVGPGGGSGRLAGGGTYVAMLSPIKGSAQRNFTLILESLEGECNHGWGVCPGATTTPQTISVKLQGRYISGISALHVWHTNQTIQFEYLGLVHVANGSFTLPNRMEPDSIYTLSTTIGQRKGKFPLAPPPSRSFPFPYADNFQSENYRPGGMAKYFSDQGGFFTIAVDSVDTENNADVSTANKFLRQIVTKNPGPNGWIANPDPITVIGDGNWTDYSVSCSMRLAADNSAGQYFALCGRLANWLKLDSDPIIPAYCLNISGTGQWKFTTSAALPPLVAGDLPAFDATQWHSLQLNFKGNSIKGLVDGHPILGVQDNTFSNGATAIGCGYHVADFDEFTVQQV